MERGRPQGSTSRSAPKAIPTKVYTEKMVQITGGESMGNQVEGRDQG